jgi:hypothetical protein
MEPRSLSQLLGEISGHFQGVETVSVGQLLDAFHERGFGFFLFLIALPAALPLPALGINALIALPLLLLTGQQVLGFRTIWLPESLKHKEISRQSLQSGIEKALPWIERIEYLIRPRLGFMTQGAISHIIGLCGFIMALSVTLPVPLTNTVPSMGICAMAVGVLMRDGLAVLAGMVIGIGWVAMLVIAFTLFGMEGLDLVKESIKSFL